MKKSFFTYLIAVSIGLFSAVNGRAQDTASAEHGIKKGLQKTISAVKKTAKKAGNKTAELAAKSKADVADKEYKEKEGPDGQKIYINNKSKYYWVDKKGHRRFVAQSKLKDKNS